MSKKSMIIIGAGLAGLATGCYARMNGYETEIFEHHTLPGGVCTAWQRQGYTIDGDIHYLVGCQPNAPFHSACQELGFFKRNRFRILTELTSFLNEKNGQRLVVTDDLQRLAEDMKKLAPEDRLVIDEFINGCRQILNVFRTPPEPEAVKLKNSCKMPAFEYAKRFQNPFLKFFITNFGLPTIPAYSVLMTLGLLAFGQLSVVEGGSLQLPLAIAEQHANLGGKITYGADVEQILVDNNTAVGIRLSNGTVHRADLVVSAADGYSTIFQLLGGKYADQSTRDRYKQWPLFTPVNFVSFGVARQFPDEPSENFVRLSKPLDSGGKSVKELWLRIFNRDPALAPEGKTVIQAEMYTDFDYWHHLHKDRTPYEAAKTKLADTVLELLDNLYPSISSLVEMTDVATPYTLWRYTRNHRASFEGWLPTTDNVGTTIPNTLPGLANFYMAGQWVLPVASVPGVIDSGRNLVKSLCEQDGKKFSTTIK